jgi:hypothetical protein
VTEDISAAPLLARGQVDSDERQLHALGCAQELRRRMGGFSNFAVLSLACSSQNVPRDQTMGRSA